MICRARCCVNDGGLRVPHPCEARVGLALPSSYNSQTAVTKQPATAPAGTSYRPNSGRHLPLDLQTRPYLLDAILLNVYLYVSTAVAPLRYTLAISKKGPCPCHFPKPTPQWRHNPPKNSLTGQLGTTSRNGMDSAASRFEMVIALTSNLSPANH